MRVNYFYQAYVWLKLAFWLLAFITGVVFAIISLYE